MSFAIEVPGDANPLSLQELCRALQAATSTNFAERQTADRQLQTWSSQQGYYSSLQTVFLDKSLPLEMRLLAIIQLKNGIDKHWRLHAHIKGGIQPQEKAVIRSRLFQGTVEEDDKVLALHNSLATAKVVRIDYPQEWHDALSNIIGLLRASKDGNQAHLYGGLQILLRVIKEMGTARLRKSQTALQSMAPEIAFLLGEIYSEKTTVWVNFLTSGRGDEDDADLAMLNSLFSLKTLRRMVVMGYESPHDDKTVQEFWTVSQNHFGQFLNFVSHDSIVPAPYQDMVGKHLLQFTKMHLDMSEAHPASFVILPNSLALVHAYWDLVAKFAEVFDKSGGIRSSGAEAASEAKSKVEGPLLERLALKGLLLMRACRRIAYSPKQTFKYKSPKSQEEEKQAVELMKSELFKSDFVIQMVNTVITHLLVFRKADLEAWEENPEEWEQQEQSEGNAYEWEVRPCAERLYLDLVTDHKELLIPPLLAYFATASAPGADIATKEAVYTALGLAAAHLANRFDFDSLVSSTLVQDAQQEAPLHKVLRRRIAILISQWVTVQLGPESKPLAYDIYRHFLNPDDENNDLVVRITAARQLKWILDDLDFDPPSFLPHTSHILSELIELIKTVEVDESKLAVLETVRLLVMRMEEHIAQFGDFIMTALPGVWDSSGTEEFMMKQAVIGILSALVMSMGAASQKFHHFMIPLLAEATQPGSELHVALIDESLELWNNLLIQCNAPASTELLNLVELALPILEYQTSTAQQALSVVDAYILLAPEAIVGDKLRQPIIQALGVLMDSPARSLARDSTYCLENVIRIAQDIGGVDGVKVIMQDMHATGLLGKLMENLHDAWEAGETTGPRKRSAKIGPAQEMEYVVIISRLALADPILFVEMLQSMGPLDAVFPWLSKEWFGRIDYADDPNREKLFLLGITRLLEMPSEAVTGLVLARLQDFMDMWTSVILDLQDGVFDGADSLIYSPEMMNPNMEDEYDNPKSRRERLFTAKDPIHTVNALEFVKERLQALVLRVGGEQVFEQEWAVNVDTDVLQRFWGLIRGTGTGHGA